MWLELVKFSFKSIRILKTMYTYNRLGSEVTAAISRRMNLIKLIVISVIFDEHRDRMSLHVWALIPALFVDDLQQPVTEFATD